MIQAILNSTIHRYGYKPKRLKLCCFQVYFSPPIYNPENPNARRWFWTVYWRDQIWKSGLL